MIQTTERVIRHRCKGAQSYCTFDYWEDSIPNAPKLSIIIHGNTKEEVEGKIAQFIQQQEKGTTEAQSERLSNKGIGISSWVIPKEVVDKMGSWENRDPTQGFMVNIIPPMFKDELDAAIDRMRGQPNEIYSALPTGNTLTEAELTEMVNRLMDIAEGSHWYGSGFQWDEFKQDCREYLLEKGITTSKRTVSLSDVRVGSIVAANVNSYMQIREDDTVFFTSDAMRWACFEVKVAHEKYGWSMRLIENVNHGNYGGVNCEPYHENFSGEAIVVKY